MFNIISVTNRKLCKDNFQKRIAEISDAADYIVLREKDLSENDYYELAKNLLPICRKKLIIHNFYETALNLKIKNIHLPLHMFEDIKNFDASCFNQIGASCHSVEDALKAQKLGCTYIFAGHIFKTDCKKGLEGRGLEFLNNICQSVDMPVYAIGGINRSNIIKISGSLAKGACIMSGFMQCDNVNNYINELKEGIK